MYARRVNAQRQRNPCLSDLSAYLQQPHSAWHQSRIVCLEFFDNSSTPTKREIPTHALHDELQIASWQEPSSGNGAEARAQQEPKPVRQGCILLVQDIAKEAIEELGSLFDIDPYFFASYVHRAWRISSTQSPATCSLPSRDNKQSFLPLQYHRTVAFQQRDVKLTSLTRNCNHRRKAVILSPIGGEQVGLVQHCCSVLLVNLPAEKWISIILVDPPISNNYAPSRVDKLLPPNLESRPFVDGCEDFSDSPATIADKEAPQKISNRDMLEELVYYWLRGPPPMFTAEAPTLQALSYYPLKIVAAEWVNYIFVLGMSLREYELSVSLTGDLLAELEKLNTNLRMLQGWRRRILATQEKMRRIIRFIQSRRDVQRPSEDWDALQQDYEFILTGVSEHGERLEAMVPLVTSAAALIESRRSLSETANVTRLTVLALVFIPLSYSASLFSMPDDFAPGKSHFWVYFATAIPLAVVVLLLAKIPASAMTSVRTVFLRLNVFRAG